MDIFFNMSLKLKLSEFIEDKLQKRIIMRIHEIYGSLNCPFKLKLWYDEGEIKPKELKGSSIAKLQKILFGNQMVPVHDCQKLGIQNQTVLFKNGNLHYSGKQL